LFCLILGRILPPTNRDKKRRTFFLLYSLLAGYRRNTISYILFAVPINSDCSIDYVDMHSYSIFTFVILHELLFLLCFPFFQLHRFSLFGNRRFRLVVFLDLFRAYIYRFVGILAVLFLLVQGRNFRLQFLAFFFLGSGNFFQ